MVMTFFAAGNRQVKTLFMILHLVLHGCYVVMFLVSSLQLKTFV